MKDFLGKTIKVGDYLVYGRRDGNASKTSLYIVTSVTEKAVKAKALGSIGNSSYYDESRWSTTSTLSNPRRTVIVSEEDALNLIKQETEK